MLSDLGREQVRALVDGLERRGVSASRVIAGSLRRQQDTAQACAEAVGLSVEVDERWNEYDDRDILTHHASTPTGLERRPGDGELSSRDFQEILNNALLAWISAGSGGPCRETWSEFGARVSGALRGLTENLGRGQTAVVISSGGTIAAATVALLDLPPQALVTFNHVSINTGITKVAVGRRGSTLVSSNEHAHLEEAGSDLISYR